MPTQKQSVFLFIPSKFKFLIAFELVKIKQLYSEKLTELSMGMSGDFITAIEEGSTMVRVGTSLFGARE